MCLAIFSPVMASPIVLFYTKNGFCPPLTPPDALRALLTRSNPLARLRRPPTPPKALYGALRHQNDPLGPQWAAQSPTPGRFGGRSSLKSLELCKNTPGVQLRKGTLTWGNTTKFAELTKSYVHPRNKGG